VVLSWAAANRDPEVFDDPNRFDLAATEGATRVRRRNSPLPGAHLAPARDRVSLEEWLRRIPEFTLACDEVE